MKKLKAVGEYADESLLRLEFIKIRRQRLRSGVSYAALLLKGSTSLALLTATLAPSVAADRHFLATTNTFWNLLPSGGFDGAGSPGANDRAIYDRAGTAQSMMSGSVARNVGQLVFLAPYTGSGFVTSPILNALFTIHGVDGLGVDNRVDQQITLPARLAIGSTQEWRISSASGSLSLLTSGAAKGFDLGSHTLTLNAVNAANYFRLDNVITGIGGIAVTGAGTTFLTANNTYSGGTALNGGTLSVASDANLGTGALTFNGGVLQVTGTSFTSTARAINWGAGGGGFDISNAANTFTVGQSLTGGPLSKYGTGTLNLTGVNAYTGLTTISAGTLALIGGGSIADSSRVHADGTFDISGTTAGTSIRSLSGNGFVDLGAQTLTLTSAFSTFAGAIQGTGGLTVAGGTQTLSGANIYTGATSVAGGTLRAGVTNAFSAASVTTVSTGGTLDLNAFNQTLPSLANAGLVRFGGAPGTTLNVTGNYVGNGGTLNVNTRLGGDTSPTDRLVVNGGISGTSHVRVTNIGGGGAQTTEGIKIIQVDGASNGSFSLLGDYVFHGQQALVSGAYAYVLQKNGIADPADGDWYLRSNLLNPPPAAPSGPIYQPGVPLYEVYPQVLLALNSLPTLRQRAGNRSLEADSIRVGTLSPGDQSGEGQISVWGRSEGSYAKATPSGSVTVRDYTLGEWKARTGVDLRLYQSDEGTLIGGLTAHYGQAIVDVRSKYGDGRINTTGSGGGGTLTWYGVNGFYVDGQAQATSFDSDFKSNLVGRGMANGVGGYGYALSLETGKRIGVDGPWTLTPQAQLVYSSVNSDFLDHFGASVSLARNDSLSGRLGLALDHQQSWRDARGMLTRVNAYGITNVYYEFLGGAGVTVGGNSFASSLDRLAAGFGVGGTYNWDNDKYSVYGEALVKTSFGDDYSIGGTAGFRAKW